MLFFKSKEKKTTALIFTTIQMNFKSQNKLNYKNKDIIAGYKML